MPTRHALPARVSVAAATAVLVAGCSSLSSAPQGEAAPTVAGTASVRPSPSPSRSAEGSTGTAPRTPGPFRDPLPGMPPVLDDNVYAATAPRDLAPQVRHDPALVYVPNSSPSGDTVTVISQRTRRVVRTLHVGLLSQHVTPSYDLRTLYTNSSVSNELVAIDPETVRTTGRISVPRPYNLYFTPDGRQAVVMVEENDIIRFADPQTFRKQHDVRDPACRGPNHADFSADGRFLVVACEFSGTLLKISTTTHQVLGKIHMQSGSIPQDVRLSPDGRTFYVANLGLARVERVSASSRFRLLRSIPTGAGPHGLYPSRDGRRLYVSDRSAGEVSVVSFRTNRVVATWHVPGGSPDMGGVSADGRVLWLSGRFNSEVYAISTRTGRLLARIGVPGSPHGLCVWPQPGRYSLGHTGNMR